MKSSKSKNENIDYDFIDYDSIHLLDISELEYENMIKKEKKILKKERKEKIKKINNGKI